MQLPLQLCIQQKYHSDASDLDDKGSNRYIDIIAVDRINKLAYIIDPTIRYETNPDVDKEVVAEKKHAYEPCIDDIKRC